jgi:hypothetical protein
MLGGGGKKTLGRDVQPQAVDGDAGKLGPPFGGGDGVT